VKATDKQELSEKVQDGQGEGTKHFHVTHVVINAQQSAVLSSQLKVFPFLFKLISGCDN